MGQREADARKYPESGELMAAETFFWDDGAVYVSPANSFKLFRISGDSRVEIEDSRKAAHIASSASVISREEAIRRARILE